MRRFSARVLSVLTLLALLGVEPGLFAQPRGNQLIPAPARKAGEGAGPFKTLVIRGAMLIDGTGAPPRGPVDIVIEQNRIREIRSAGTPGLPLAPRRPPQDADFEVDATGMYVMPGIVDDHVHIGGPPKNPEAEYVYKLWMAHGVTTVRGVSLTSHAMSVSERDRSARNEIVAPRMFNYQTAGSGWDQGPVDTPEQARAWVQWAVKNGVDGIKLFATRPEIAKELIGWGGASASARLPTSARRAWHSSTPSRPRAWVCIRSRTSTGTSRPCCATTSCSPGRPT